MHLCRPLPPSQTTASGEEYYRRLQAFRDELAGMPVAIQVCRGQQEVCVRVSGIDWPGLCCKARWSMHPQPSHNAAMDQCRFFTSSKHRSDSPITLQTASANDQHYEIPTEYFLAALGPHRKYSSCLYDKVRKTTFLGALLCAGETVLFCYAPQLLNRPSMPPSATPPFAARDNTG